MKLIEAIALGLISIISLGNAAEPVGLVPLAPSLPLAATFHPHPEAALTLLKQRALKGDPSAQVTLAEGYANGRQGLEQNSVEAYRWARKASSSGQKHANYLLAELELFMTPSEILAARADADRWNRTNSSGEQAHDLAYAFHNLPMEIYGWGTWSVAGTRDRLQYYQKKHSQNLGVDYVALFDKIYAA